MPKLPYVEFHAPQIDPLVGAPGIVEILWGDRRDDGTFAEVRIRFLDAGLASVRDRGN